MRAFFFFDLPQNSGDLDHTTTFFRLWGSLSVGLDFAVAASSLTPDVATRYTSLMQVTTKNDILKSTPLDVMVSL
jgi:hypothetical protein